jgi:G3E family GTPase
MCGLCGMFESGRRWLDAAATLDSAKVHRERLRRVAIVRQVLKPMHVAVDDWQGASFVLRGPTGRSEIVDNLFDLWQTAETLGHRKLDPLNQTCFPLPRNSGERSELHKTAQPRTSSSETRPPPGIRPTSSETQTPADATSETTTRIPVHVLTGFLGSGKTTLLNRILREPALADSAVLINEIGAIAIDHHLVERMEQGDAIDVVVLKGGCACCTVRGDLVEALRELYARRADGTLPPFRRVILETTGLADPAPVLFTLACDPVLRHKFEAAAVIATVDAVHGASQAARHPECRKQIAVADCLVITKTDLMQAAKTAALAAQLARMNPAARIVDANGATGVDGLLADARTHAILRPVSRQAHEPDGSRDGEHAHRADHTQDIESIAMELKEPIEWSAFAIWLTLLLHAHGDRMLRFKALLDVDGWPALVALNAVHHLIHPPIHLRASPGEPRASSLVFIAQGLPLVGIDRSLRGFLASTAAPMC